MSDGTSQYAVEEYPLTKVLIEDASRTDEKALAKFVAVLPDRIDAQSYVQAFENARERILKVSR